MPARRLDPGTVPLLAFAPVFIPKADVADLDAHARLVAVRVLGHAGLRGIVG